MNVLSLFDGMSCGQIALDRLGLKVDNYFASEVDKYAMQVTMSNFPKTIQLGDVRNINPKVFPKIDLLLAGSPCQGFSFAGNDLNFNHPKSKLFFEFVRILRELKPKYFLLENVRMKKEYEKIITEMVGVEPIVINSNLVSAQNRHRLYWTNIPNVDQPEDKEISLPEVLAWGRSTRYPKDGDKYVEQRTRDNGKSNTLTTGGGCGSLSSMNYIATTLGSSDNRVFRETKKLGCLTASMYKGIRSAGRPIVADKSVVGRHLDEVDKSLYRMLTPEECEFLQTVPRGYTESASNTQRYKMLGNGWTVDVITHILKNMEIPEI